VLQRVREAQTRQPVAHRATVFRELYDRIGPALQQVFRTTSPVVTATGSATLMMEAAIASTVESRVLHLICGAFSGRFHTIAKALGKAADHVTVPLGQAVEPDLVRQALRRGRYDAVTVVHSETATGVLSPLADIAQVVREESDALLVVDAVSSLGGAPLETEAWGLDVVLTGSQKCLALPPGLGFAAISERAERRITAVSRRGFYTDLVRYLAQHRDGGTITTAAVTLYWALDLQLPAVLAEGMERRWERHAAMQRRTLDWAAERGIAVPAAANRRSPTVTTLGAPAGTTAPELVKALARRGYTVAGGYAEWKPTTFRIGHMGDVTMADLDGLLAAIDEILAGG
jgi:aspartate aminotransferase-like enzyme